MGFEGSPNFGGFLGVGAKYLEHKNIPFYSIINPEKIKDLSSNECFFFSERLPVKGERAKKTITYNYAANWLKTYM